MSLDLTRPSPTLLTTLLTTPTFLTSWISWLHHYFVSLHCTTTLYGSEIYGTRGGDGTGQPNTHTPTNLYSINHHLHNCRFRFYKPRQSVSHCNIMGVTERGFYLAIVQTYSICGDHHRGVRLWVLNGTQLYITLLIPPLCYIKEDNTTQ